MSLLSFSSSNELNEKLHKNDEDDDEEEYEEYECVGEEEDNDVHKVLDLSIKSKHNQQHQQQQKDQIVNKRKKKPQKTTKNDELEDEYVEPVEQDDTEQELNECTPASHEIANDEEADEYINESESLNNDDLNEFTTSSSLNNTHNFTDDTNENEIKQANITHISKKNKTNTKPLFNYSHQQHNHHNQHHQPTQQQTVSTPTSTKKQMRFQCRFCVYKSHSVSLMQNHIYRHIDTTPYSCFYCGHKSTTKSTIMVHIELCHPNMEVKIKESRVKEEDYYLDLNSSSNQQQSETNTTNSGITTNKEHKQANNTKKFEIISKESAASSLASSNSSLSSVCSSPSVSPGPNNTKQQQQLEFIQPNEDDLLNQEKEGNSYVTVFNRPKQYFGSLYEPDKQYSCKLCTYTTNHKPSMEDHVYVHTNKRPYR